MDARLEVAVAGKYRRNDQLVFGDRLVERRVQVAGVTDARRAAIAGERETELGERRQQPGPLQIIGHHARARSERSLDVWPDPQAFGDGLPGQQPGSDHHRRVTGIGARGNGRDQHIAVAEIDDRSLGRIAQVQRFRRSGKAIGGFRGAKQALETVRHLGQCDAILRALRPGQRGHNARQIEAHRARIVDLAGQRNAEQLLRPEIGLEQFASLRVAPGGAHEANGVFVDRKKAHRRAIFRRHVGQRRAVGNRQGARAGAEELDKGTDHLLATQQFGHSEDQIGCRNALVQATGQFNTDDVRRQEIDRLAEHGSLRLDAADAPADDAEAVDHRRVRIGTDQRIGEKQRPVSAFLPAQTVEQVLEIDLMHNADPRRHDTEGLERLHSPFHELIALAVALELERHVLLQGLRRAVVIDLHRVIDHQIDRNQRLDSPRIDAPRHRHLAHGRQVAEQRHPGEILQDNASDDERNLLAARRLRLPVCQFADMPFAHPLAVAVAQQRLKHDTQRDRQARDVADAGTFKCRQRVKQRVRVVREPGAGKMGKCSER